MKVWLRIVCAIVLSAAVLAATNSLMTSAGVPGSWGLEEICSKYESYWPDKPFASAQEMESWLAKEGLQWRKYDEIGPYTVYQCDDTKALEDRLAKGSEVISLEVVLENNQMKSIYLAYSIHDKERVTLAYASDGQGYMMVHDRRTDQYINVFEDKAVVYYHFFKRNAEYIIDGGRCFYE